MSGDSHTENKSESCEYCDKLFSVRYCAIRIIKKPKVMGAWTDFFLSEMELGAELGMQAQLSSSLK